MISLFYHGGQGIAYAPALMLILAAVLCSAQAALSPLLSGPLLLPRGVAVLSTLLFWVYLSLSLSWSAVPFASLVTWLNLSALPLTLLAVLCHPDRRDIFRFTALLMASVVLLAALYTLWQFFITGIPRAPGVLANPNNMAALLNIVLLPSLTAFLSGHYRRVSGPACAVLFAALLATGSRGGLLCAGAGLLILLIALWPQVKAQRRLIGLSLTGAFILLIGFLWLSPSPLAQNLGAILNPLGDDSVQVRLALWKTSLTMLGDHLWTGTGLGTFYLYYPAYRPVADFASLGHFTHADGLQFGIEGGMVALILFYAMIGAWIIMGVRALRTTSGVNRAVVSGCLASLMALFLHAHIEFQFYIMAILMPAAVMMAGLYSTAIPADARGYVTAQLTRRDGLIWRGALIIAALLMALTAASTASGYYFTARAEQKLRTGDIDGFFATINNAYRFAPPSFTDADLRVVSVYLDILAQAPIQMTETDRQEIFTQAEALLQDAGLSNPALADIDHKRAKLYLRADDNMVSDRLHRIELSWRTALKKDPLHTIAREEFARFLMAQGRVSDAYDVVVEGLQRPGTRAAQTAFQTLAAQLKPLVILQQQYQDQSKPTP
ncbi:MAG TPA: O-antigen ligase family protein [Micavibrio sp.]